MLDFPMTLPIREMKSNTEILVRQRNDFRRITWEFERVYETFGVTPPGAATTRSPLRDD